MTGTTPTPISRRPLLAAAAAATVAAPAILSPLPAIATGPVYGAETFTLSNGMLGVVIPMRRAPVVAHMVWYKVGGADEPAGLGGMAHFLEHLMFKGTPNLGSGLFSRRVAREGGRDNAFTGHDYTAYFQQVAADRLSLVMGMEADRMQNLLLDPKDIEPERLVILEERRQVVDSNPRSRFRERLTAMFHENHPYGRPIIGWEAEIRTIPRQALMDFHTRYYGPSNAILMIQGDVTTEQVQALAERTYGAIPRGGEARSPRPQDPPPAGERRLTLSDARVREPSVTRMYPAPHALGDLGTSEALEVLAHVLGSGPTSRLWKALVDPGIAASAGAGYGGDTVDRTDFAIYATPRPGHDKAEIEAVIDAVVAKVTEDGVSEAEIAQAIRQMTAGAAFARDSLMGGARSVGAALTIGLPLDYVERWPARIAAVTPERVTDAARAILGGEGVVTGWLVPAAGARRA